MQAEAIREQALIGRRYRVLKLLGQGGMGAVYQVRDEATGRELALKRMHGHLTQREMFEREYRTLASLRHAGIVSVFEYGVDDEGAFYTMELLTGADLSKRAPMAWRDVCVCLRDCASILGVLHAHKLLHRDLNPRNLWQLPDGRVKLLDFGALTPFGRVSNLVGAPGFVPPEALRTATLDQRSDLFTLGALGYWLLTSAHAYRADSFATMEQAWSNPPAAPSSLAKVVEGADNDIPEQLDKLVLSLLRTDPDERPSTTVTVIDELNAIAGLKREAEDAVVGGYLDSGALHGRDREREMFATWLARASKGKPQALCLEGREGIGRTRLVHELVVTARMAGAIVLCGSSGSAERPYATATSIAHSLMTALPYAAREFASKHGAILATLSPELARNLGSPEAPRRVTDPAEERQRKQQALTAWLLAVAAEHLLMVVVDDLHSADEESQALLATLARASPGHRLLVLATVCTETSGNQVGLRAFQATASRVVLPRLRREEVAEMLRCIFGVVPFLERLAGRVFEVSSGVPGHVQALARHLVRSGAARYVDGAWVLPREVPTDLPSTLEHSAKQALESLPVDARRLAQLASVPDSGALSRTMLTALHGASPERTERAIAALLREHLVVQSSDGLRVAQPMLASALWSELTAQERASVHRAVAELLEASADPVVLMRKALHLLRAGDFDAAEALVLAAARTTEAATTEVLRAVAPLFADACELLKAAQRPEHARLPALGVLAVAGYLVDRSFAARFGDEAVELLQRALHFDLARRAKPFLGGMLSLLLALAAASMTLRVRRAGVGALQIVSWLVAGVIALVGTATTCIDPRKGRRYTEAITPLLALGRHHAATLAHQFCTALTVGTEDRPSETLYLAHRVVSRLLDPTPIRGISDAQRTKFLAGARFSAAVREALCADERALQNAAALDSMGPMASFQADQVRAVYFGTRGDSASAAAYEKRIDLNALQLGTAWQSEIWLPLRALRLALLTGDPVAAKRASEALSGLMGDLPHLRTQKNMARATYLVLRQKYAEALELLEADGDPLGTVGWSYGRGLLAKVYNHLGQHERAEAVCVDALTRLQPADLDFISFTLALTTELAVAQASQGRVAEAEAHLSRLLERHQHRGAVALGWVHQTRARVAHVAGDRPCVERELELMEQQYRSTSIPSLHRLSAELKRELLQVGLGTTNAEVPLSMGDSHLITRIQRAMTSEPMEPSARALRALMIALEIGNATHGFIAYSEGAIVALPERSPAVAAFDWALERLRRVGEDEGDTAIEDAAHLDDDDSGRVFEGTHHRLCFLWRRDGSPLGALVLASEIAEPELPSAAALRVLSDGLARSEQGSFETK